MRWVALLVLFVSCASQAHLYGQETWSGLHFGSSADDAQKVLAKQNMQMELSKGTGTVKPDWKLKLPDGDVTMNFRPFLIFSENNELTRVTLILEGGQVGSKKDDTGDAFFFKMINAPFIGDLLVNKYGSPVSRSDDCKTELGRALTNDTPVLCEIKWKSDGQAILFQYFFQGVPAKRMDVHIYYEIPTAGGL
jgi:hypothetical protein